MTSAPHHPPMTARPRLNRLTRCERGTATVELAFVLPVFLVMLFVAVEFGRVMYAKAEFEYAVFNASRFATVNKTANEAAVKKSLTDSFMLLKPANLKAAAMTEVANADKTRTATFVVSYDVDLLLPITEHKAITLSRTIAFLRAP